MAPLRLLVLAAALAPVLLRGAAPEPGPERAAPRPAAVGSAGTDDWIPIDDPDLMAVPAALRLLPYRERAVFESTRNPWLLLARRKPSPDGLEAALVEDEEALSKTGALVPVEEDYLAIQGDEAFFLECDWKVGESTFRVAAIYALASEGEVTAVWIVAPEDGSPKRMQAEAKSWYRHLRSSFEPPAAEAYAGILNRHQVAFELESGSGRNSIALQPVPESAAADRAFFEAMVKANPAFVAEMSHDWRDEDRDASLSMQVFRTDTALAPRDPFLVWMAEQLQTFVRGDPDEGDAPVELIFLEDARTHVLSREELDRHYANNRLAKDAGVILKTFLPRSPYARAARIAFSGKEDPRPSLALLVELRDYPRSRSETVARVCVVLLLARAPKRDDLLQLEAALAFHSAPVTSEPLLAELPR